MPINGTIETITLTETYSVNGVIKRIVADVKVKVAGANLIVTPSLFDDTDTFRSKLLGGDQVLDFSPFPINSFAGDGRDLPEGTSCGSNDFISLIDDARGERIVKTDLLLAGDFLSVNAGAPLRGGNDDLDDGRGRDKMFGGGDGAVSLLGGKDDGDLSGGPDNDTLRGGAGSDTLTGGSGDDLLDGLGMTDAFLFEGTWGNDTIDGYTPSGTGGPDDLLSIEGVLDLTTFNFFATQVGNDVLFDNGTSTIRILDVELSDFTNADFI